MLTNQASTGTWPRTRSVANSTDRGSSLLCQQKTSSLNQDKKPRYKEDHTTITLNFRRPENVQLTSQVANNKVEYNFSERCPPSVKIRNITVENHGKIINPCINLSFAQRKETTDREIEEGGHVSGSKISENGCRGNSIDSNVSSVDVFESFDTVSEVSTLSQFSDGERIEKCFSDLHTANVWQDTVADSLSVYSETQPVGNIQSNRLCYGFIHGSFQDVSLTEPRGKFKSYGIRDLQSETGLNNLKEHILCAERYKDPRTIEPRTIEPIISGRGIGNNLGASLQDKLISLSTGHVFLEKPTKGKSRNQRKVFSSVQDLDKDTMTMSYFDSLRYIKQKDVESCRASGPGLKHGTAGEKVTFYVFSDKDNTKLLKVYVTGPRLVPPKTELSCLAEGFYSVSYWPDRVGWYIVNVLWRGKHISGSPFHVLMLLPKCKVWIKRSDVFGPSC